MMSENAVVDWLARCWLWLTQNWQHIVIPLLVFLATYVAGLWVRRVAYRAFNRWAARGRWEGSKLVIETTRAPFLHWFLILGALMAIHVSGLSAPTKLLADRVLATLFVVSLTWVAASLSEKVLRLYIGKVERLQPSERLLVNIARATIAVVGALMLLDIWGAPTTPVILVLAAGVLVAALVFRDLLADLLSGFQLIQEKQLKVGDFIKLGSGESGYVTEITWRNTKILGLDSNLILIPNNRLVQGTIINYGRPLKRASKPFRFYTRLCLRELTGLKARNLKELLVLLREVPESVIYFHTHHFLEQHHYLIPEPANDFALWVSDELGEETLGEKLASIDTFEFPTIDALRARIEGVISDYLAQNPDGRGVGEGREFHFIKSISFVLPTPYVAHDLREFVEVLRQISLNSLNYHVFEARLRLRKGVNDFSAWIEDCLGDRDLAEKLAYLDPYNYTLEGLRSAIIQLIEKRIK